MSGNVKEVDDLKEIKKHYGEKMMQICRMLFPTILETPGLLFKIMSNHFESNHSLYEDLDVYGKFEHFKDYIYSLLDEKEPIPFRAVETPEKLMLYAGYILYECKYERDIQNFKKYYKYDEVLCTFIGNRLNRCHVFFAVKKDVDSIKRESFEKPDRQDEYGTSVISIQFTRDNSHTLSIKNRYNHKVKNPDATFSNNLDNIIPDLTASFEQHYGMIQHHNDDFELRNYVQANDGKYYKYNYEINNIYYCPNNIIIDNYNVIRLPKDNSLLIDYYILDLHTKELTLYDQTIRESFVETIPEINKIKIINDKNTKKILISNNNVKENVEIIVDKDNVITSIVNKTLTSIGDSFLHYNKALTSLTLPAIKHIGKYFLMLNMTLNNLDVPLLEKVDHYFLGLNDQLSRLKMPMLRQVGDGFLEYNHQLTSLELPVLEQVGNDFLLRNRKLTTLDLPSLKYVGNQFLYENKMLTKLQLPFLKEIGNEFLFENQQLASLEIPLIEKIGDDFLYRNEALTNLELPRIIQVGSGFLKFNNNNITYSILPLLKQIRNNILDYYEKLINKNSGQEQR